MTIALAINTNEGAVIASDSASSMVTSGSIVINVYNNANKLFNLFKGQPIGVATYGAGSIGPYGIGLLAKEFRKKLESEYTTVSANPRFWPQNYTLEDVANRFKSFIFDESYEQAYPLVNEAEYSTADKAKERDALSVTNATSNEEQLGRTDDEELLEEQPNEEAENLIQRRPSLGFILTGFSSSSKLPETYVIETDGISPVKITKPLDDRGFGLVAKGMPEAIERLYYGFSRPILFRLASKFQLDEELFRVFAMEFLQAEQPLIHPAMPLQDAIDLARFFVELTINYQRFSPDDKTVGGPIEIATMTKYEGFKWVQRKHYYTAELNPPVH